MATQDKFPGDKLHVDILGSGDIAAITPADSYIDKLPLVKRQFDNGLKVEELSVCSEFKGLSLQAHFNMDGVSVPAETTLRVEVEVLHLTGSDDPVADTFQSVDLSSIYGECVAPECVNLADNRIYLDVEIKDAQADGVKAVAKCEIDLLRNFGRYLRFKFTPASLDSAGGAAGLAGGEVIVLGVLEGSDHKVELEPAPTPTLAALP